MKRNKKSPLKKLLKYVFKYKASCIAVVFSAMVSVFASLFSVIIVGNAIDTMTNGVDIKELTKICILLLSLIGLYIISEWLMEVASSRVTYNVVKDLRNDTFNAVLNVPLSFIDKNKTGELLSRMTADMEQISDGLIMTAMQLFSGIMTIIATLVIMMTINYKIGLIVVFITPISLIVATFISKGTHKHFKRQSEIRADITSQIQDAVSQQTLYKIYNYQNVGKDIFENTNDELEKCSVKAVFISSLPNPTTRFVNNIIYALTGLVGALSILNGGRFALTVGKLTMFLTYAQKYAKPFNEISDVFTEIQSATASAERVFMISEAPVEECDKYTAVTLENVDGNVNIEDISFSYDKDKELIKDFSLKVKTGEKIAIVGKTGCGKTTFINLLMRFYDVDGGKITVSGYDIKDVTRNSLRLSYAMVLQDSYIFSGTVKDNVKFGRTATDEEVIEALKNAHAYSFVQRLPNGIYTEINESCNFSEGQKQLLCIARAMLCLPQMLILDEATSSVDTRTEIKIQQAFDEMMKGRTSFVVAHRLSTIKKADVILVMDKGKIIEKGNHEQLLSQNGFYTKLYNSQFAK